MARPGLSTTRGDSEELEHASPDPLEHATPGSELAEAQLALGRPDVELEPGGEDASESVDEFESEAEDAAEAAESHDALESGQPGDPVAEEEFYLDEYGDSDPVESGPGEAIVGGGGRPPRRRRGPAADDGDGDSGGELEETEAPVPAVRQNIVGRLIHFLQGSWRELQRVQWPDRRQVMQATGVVIGFVVVAGVFLGVADFLAGKLVNFILK